MLQPQGLLLGGGEGGSGAPCQGPITGKHPTRGAHHPSTRSSPNTTTTTTTAAGKAPKHAGELLLPTHLLLLLLRQDPIEPRPMQLYYIAPSPVSLQGGHSENPR